MPISTINSKGQTTVTKEVREALDLEAGDKLTWIGTTPSPRSTGSSHGV